MEPIEPVLTTALRDHYLDLSNEVLYDILSQRASKLPQVISLELQFY